MLSLTETVITTTTTSTCWHHQKVGCRYVKFPTHRSSNSIPGQGTHICSSVKTPSKGAIHSCNRRSLPLSPPKVTAEFKANTIKLVDRTHTPRLNITIQEAKVIKELKSDKSRIILTADKGVAMVVMERQDYNTKPQGLLDNKDTYRPLSKDPTAKYKSQLLNILKNCKAQEQIIQDTYKNFTPLVPSPSSSMTY